MAENENTAPEAAPQEEAPQFAVQRIYLKDASLEMPNAPEIFLAPEAPQVDIQLDVSEHGLAQPLVESPLGLFAAVLWAV